MQWPSASAASPSTPSEKAASMAPAPGLPPHASSCPLLFAHFSHFRISCRRPDTVDHREQSY
eukprot:11850515-Heterocapsa_arctica.AAC.1